MKRLQEACKNTFRYRMTEFNVDKIINELVTLKSDTFIIEGWNNYKKNYTYAKDINFDDVIKTVIELVKLLE